MRISGWRSDWAVLLFFENETGNAFNSEWLTLSLHDNAVLVAWAERCGYGRHVVPSVRRNLSHCARNNWVVARGKKKMSRPRHLTQWRSELAAEFVRFDTVRLLPLGGGVVKSLCLCQQTTNNSWAQGGDSTVTGETEPQLCGNAIDSLVKWARVCQQSCEGRLSDSCSTANHSVCTSYWNKNISTFWINGAFYYKIKSCALVGTPLYDPFHINFPSKPRSYKWSLPHTNHVCTSLLTSVTCPVHLILPESIIRIEFGEECRSWRSSYHTRAELTVCTKSALASARQPSNYVCMYIGFKTSFYVDRHLDSTASCLPTGLHLGFFRSRPSL